MDVSRRDFVVGALAASFAGACARPGGEPGVLRVAYMGNLTHAPIVSGVGSGRIAKALAPLRIETRVVGAGPRVVEALLGGTVDVGIAGPAAIVSAQALHGNVLTIASGVCSGGASLVLRRGEREDALAGRTLATPQLGSTQDVSLRKWLRKTGRGTTERGGDVRVTQMMGALAQIEMTRGTLAGAWMPEPWATRLALETPAFRAFDERETWPGGDFASAVVVARTDFLRARLNDVARFVSAAAEEIARASADESRLALSRAVHATWNARVWSEAWSRVRFTSDPMRRPIETFARDAFDLGVLREPLDASALFAT
jgi:NitT/TauT family transport system substrate-binding protein